MNKKIMIVDDALFMRITLKKILSGAGYRDIVEAKDGEEAVMLYETERPELVLMDISMPNMDGIEALKAIRQMDEEAVIVMCSAVGQDGMIVEAIDNGAADFIVKPFEPEQIINAVKKILESSDR